MVVTRKYYPRSMLPSGVPGVCPIRYSLDTCIITNATPARSRVSLSRISSVIAAGYANTQRALHKLQKGLEDLQLPYTTKRKGVVLEHYDTTSSGFLRLTATSQQLAIEYFR